MLVDTVQAGIFLFGGVMGLFISLQAVGGWESMKANLPKDHDYLSVMLRTSGPYRWPAHFGILVSSVLYRSSIPQKLSGAVELSIPLRRK